MSETILPDKLKPKQKSASWYGIFIVAFLSVFLNLLVLVAPVYTLQIFDRVLPSHSFTTLAYLTLFAITAIVALGALESLRTRALSRIAGWWDEENRPKVLSASVLATLQSGTPVTHGIQDLQAVRQFIASSAPLPLFDAPWVPFFIFVLFVLHPYLGVLALVTAIILFALAVLNDVIARKSLQGVSDAQVLLNSAAIRAVRNADTIQAMGMHNALNERYLHYNSAVQNALRVSGDRGSIVTGCAKFIRISAQIGIMGGGAYLVLQNQLTPGGMIAASIILGRALAPVEQAIGAWRSLIATREANNRLQGLISLYDSQDEVIDLHPPTGRIAVENVSFVPANSLKAVLKGVSFNLEAGSSLAIIGASASGKSTLCKLLIGSMKPSAGNVRLDGADLWRWDRADIGNHVGYMSQAVELFSGTAKENIARLGEIDDEAVVDAAVLAGCHEMILGLPNGYETDLGDAGAFLSGGQRQRIGLARALYRRPKLIVLDEPDAHLDDIGVHCLIQAISTLNDHGSTVIIVTHRQPLIRPCKKLMVLNAGRLELFGETAEVAGELNRRIKELPQRQSAGAQPGSVVAE